jgi:hypothetical protein
MLQKISAYKTKVWRFILERERERDPSCKISALKMDKGHYQSHDSSLRRLELSQQKLIESKLYYDVSLALYPAIVH